MHITTTGEKEVPDLKEACMKDLKEGKEKAM